MGEGYCISLVGSTYKPVSNVFIPESMQGPNYDTSSFCGQHFAGISNATCFETHHDANFQELECRCLMAQTKSKNCLMMYLQCFWYIPPAAIDHFYFIGAGHCRGDGDDTHDVIKHHTVSSLEGCCDVYLEMNSTKLVGQFYFFSWKQCACQFANSGVPFKSIGASRISYLGEGVGAIMGTFIFGIRCYSYDGDS